MQHTSFTGPPLTVRNVHITTSKYRILPVACIPADATLGIYNKNRNFITNTQAVAEKL